MGCFGGPLRELYLYPVPVAAAPIIVEDNPSVACAIPGVLTILDEDVSDQCNREGLPVIVSEQPTVPAKAQIRVMWNQTNSSGAQEFSVGMHKGKCY